MIINFPNNKKQIKKNISSSNRGMNLENIINETNDYYLNNNIAIIHKKPIPIQVVNVSYPSRDKAVITEAYYKTPSTTDYNGIYRGKYIDFEAKETNSKTSFVLKNVHIHQINHLKSIIDHGGIGFLIVCFKHYNEYFLLPFNILYDYYLNSLNNGRKSIEYKVFKEHAYEIKESYLPRLNYLKILDENFF